MWKKMLTLILLVGMISLVIALYKNEFYNTTLRSNITFTGDQNTTINVSLPLGVNVTKGNLTLKGYGIANNSIPNVSKLQYTFVNNTANALIDQLSSVDNDFNTRAHILRTGTPTVSAFIFENFSIPSNHEEFNITFRYGWDVSNGLCVITYSTICIDSNEVGHTIYSVTETKSVSPDNIFITRSVPSNCTQTDKLRLRHQLETYPVGGCSSGISVYIFHYETNVTYIKHGYPLNSYLHIGSPDTTYEWNYTGSFNISENTSDFSGAVRTAYNNSQCGCTGCNKNSTACIIPFLFHSDTAGILQYSNLNILYNDIAAPYWSLNLTNVSTPTTNNKSVLHSLYWQDYISLSSCTFAWNGSDGVMKNVTTRSNLTLNYTPQFCYQESANEPTSCGGLGTGTYFVNGSWSNNASIFDGDYTTSGGISGTGTSYIYINYSKPQNSNSSSLWQVKDNGQGVETNNFSLSASCFAQEPIQLRLGSANAGGGIEDTRGDCWSGTTWSSIFSHGSLDADLFEESMWWSISNILSQNISVNGTINLSLNPDVIGWKIQCNDTSGNVNISNTFTYSTANIAPQINTISVSPSPSNASQNLSCVVANATDVSSINFTWYINGVENTTLRGLAKVSVGNYTDGDKVICSGQPYDSIDHGSWINSSEVTLSDTTPPIIRSASANSVTVNIATTINAIFSDLLSSMSTAIVEVTDPNSVDTNFTMSFSSGNQSAGQNSTWIRSYTPATVGTYYLKFYYTDTSGNTNSTLDNYTSFQATAVSSSSSSGGGGGAAAIVTTTDLTIYCGNSICDTGEDAFNCARDCASTEGLAKALQNKVFQGAGLLVIAAITYIGYQERKKRKYA